MSSRTNPCLVPLLRPRSGPSKESWPKKMPKYSNNNGNFTSSRWTGMALKENNILCQNSFILRLNRILERPSASLEYYVYGGWPSLDHDPRAILYVGTALPGQKAGCLWKELGPREIGQHPQSGQGLPIKTTDQGSSNGKWFPYELVDLSNARGRGLYGTPKGSCWQLCHSRGRLWYQIQLFWIEKFLFLMNYPLS